MRVDVLPSVRRWRMAFGALAVAWGAAGAAAAATESCAQAGGRAPVSFAAVVARVSPAVLKLITFGAEVNRPQEEEEPEEFRLGALTRPEPGRLRPSAWWERSSASAFVIDSDGHALTSAHVVRDAREVWAYFSDGRRLPAQVLGLDALTDVALLRVAGAGVAPVVPGGPMPPCPGEWVAAIGSPFGFSQSVSVGVVSARPRELSDRPPMLQTDVALNPGSSGGPLFNLAGEVVGMNSMIYSSIGGYIGIAFALPIDTALRVAQQLKRQGQVPRAQLGARVQPLTADLAQAFGLPAAQGALVVRVERDGPAQAAGLRSGDVVLSIGESATAAQTYAQVRERVASAAPGERLRLRVWRQRAVTWVEIVGKTLAQQDAPAPDAPGAAAPVARLGLVLAELDDSQPQRAGGLHVAAADGAAARAGILPGDRVLAVNERTVHQLAEFDRALAHAASDAPVALLVQRGSTMRYVPVGRPGAWIPLAE